MASLTWPAPSRASNSTGGRTVIRSFDLLRRMRAAVTSVLLLSATGSYALNTATIVGSVASDCLEYRVVGICYWLYCTWTGCTVRTSVKVRHYIPDAVVSSYSNTGENPWVEVRAMSTPNPSAQAGGDGTTNEDHENNLAKFKNADVIGHPGVEVFNQFVSSSGYFCGAQARPSCRTCSVRWTRRPGATTYRRWCTGGIDPGHARGRRALDPEPLGQRLSARRLPAPDGRPQGRCRGGPTGRRWSRAAGQIHVYQPLLASSAMATGRPAR